MEAAVSSSRYEIVDAVAKLGFNVSLYTFFTQIKGKEDLMEECHHFLRAQQ